MVARVEINWAKLDSYLQLKASKKACAILLEVSEDTIERRIKEKHDCTFTDYAAVKFEPVKLKLVQKAISKAMSGDNTMLIFSLKNLCGWSDRQDVTSFGESLVLNVGPIKQ